MLVAVSLLAISLSFLIYRHPLSTWPAFFAPAQDAAARTMRDRSQKDGDEQDTPAEQQQQQQQRQQAQADLETEHIPLVEPSPATTPKAAATPAAPAAPAVPTFTLDAHSDDDDDDDDSDDQDNLPPPSFPALNSAQRASAPTPSFSMTPPALAMPPPPAPNRMAPPPKPAASSFMAPPPRVAASSLRPLPSAASQRMPTTGPLPNRGPVPNRGPPASNGSSLGVPVTAPTPKTPNARNKVLLSPGHSPLDWANLQRSGGNLSGVTSLVRVTPAMLKEKNGRKGKPAWSSYQGKVYNISPYLPYHPGGEGELRRAAGKDGTKLFMEVHPWVNWENMLGECMVGIMVSEEPAGAPTSSLEDMD